MHTWNDDNFDQAVLQQGVLAIVGFVREGCPSCERMLPILTQLNDEEADVLVGTVTTNVSAAIASRYRVRSTPMTVIFRDGEPHETFVGIRQKVELASALRNLKL